MNRCAAGRSTPTAVSTLAGKLLAPYTRMAFVGELDDRRLEVGGVMAGPDLVGPLRRSR